MILKKKNNQTDSIKNVKRAKIFEPEIIDITDHIILDMRSKFGEMDLELFIPLADHISFAIARIKKQGCMASSLTQDIIDLFQDEYDIAKNARRYIVEKTGVYFDDDELGYVAMHLHSVRENERLSIVMQETQTVRSSLDMIQEKMNIVYDYTSLDFCRFLSHIKYMLVRTRTGEKIALDINEYMKTWYKASYELAESVCKNMENEMKIEIDEVETGYMAMHIERLKAGDRVKK